MFQRFTESARVAVVAANERAITRADKSIHTTHLLIGAFESDPALAAALTAHGLDGDILNGLLDDSEDQEVLAAIGVDLGGVIEETDHAFGDGALAGASGRRSTLFERAGSKPPFNKQAKACLEQALRIAVERKEKFVCASHIALAATSAPQPLSGRLSLRGIDMDSLQNAMEACISPADD